MQKTYAVDCISNKSKKNRGEVAQYYLANTHTAIIPKEQWEQAQLQVSKRLATRISSGIPLEQKIHLIKIKGGILKGFTVLNPNWKNWELEQFFEKLNIKKGD